MVHNRSTFCHLIICAMFNQKIFNGKQFKFQFRLCAFILILYLKCDRLCASSPLIDRNEEDIELVLKPPDNVSTDNNGDDILMHNGDNNYSISIENMKANLVKSDIIKKNGESYYNYLVNRNDGNSDEVTESEGESKEDSIKNDDDDEYVLEFLAKGPNSCMLDGLKEHTMTWANVNGSITLSDPPISTGTGKKYVDISNRENITDELMASELLARHYRIANNDEIVAFSAAFNGLTYAPYKTLFQIRYSLQYLTLKGNNFSACREEADDVRNVFKRRLEQVRREGDSSEGHVKYVHEQRIAWATFPKLPSLKELDISDCRIEHISSYAFKNLTNLTTLYLSNNKIMRIPSEAFVNVPNLRYLDLAYQNILDVDIPIPIPPVEQILGLIVGVKIEQHAFKDLHRLEYLDLSHTKITRGSAVAFSFLGERLKYLSLCYTAFPAIGNALFKNTSLRGLDLSGNSYAAYTVLDDSFASVAKTLEFLFFEQSNIKDLDWLKLLKKLVVLSLSSNNINALTAETFNDLKHLQVLDLSSNHLGNWYNRIFANNSKLRILNLRDNTINIFTSEMLVDFQGLDYLGIGDNNFICNCVLKDLVDIATANNKKADCVNNVFPSTQNALQYTEYDYQIGSIYNGYMATIKKYLPMLTESYHNIKEQMNQFNKYNFHVVTRFYKALTYKQCPNTSQIVIYDKINGSTLRFQLLDYEDEHYWCFNETEKLNFFELSCESRSFTDEITKEVRHITKYVVAAASSFVIITMIVCVIYIKRWHIHYYYSSLKSAALLAVAAQENSEKFKELSESDSNLLYDLFISYCESDREWVLEELMPNIEITGDMSICMHERDFQVGLTILDNIISCMDRSRCLMLVISSNFLLSHWCQFEMRLAQHRMFEASREHLILVFLEDIPKRKRPKTLQYLMEVKTYIKWPSSTCPNSKSDEKKIFWKRLRRSIKHICWDGSAPRL